VASLVRTTWRDWDKARRVPSELRAEMTRVAALATPVWVEARRTNDFGLFLPALRDSLELRKRYVDCFEPAGEPYDVLLDDYEPGMTTAEVRRIFDYLKEHQAPLVKRVPAPDAPAARSFPRAAQQELELEILRRFGYTDEDLAGGGSDRLVDAIVAWGDASAIAERVRAHRSAGADHVCLQVLSAEKDFPRREYREISAALNG
jgi:Zn-dependent M32 family carboxypeptidase